MLIERFKNIVKSNQEQNNKKTIENLVVFIKFYNYFNNSFIIYKYNMGEG